MRAKGDTSKTLCGQRSFQDVYYVSHEESHLNNGYKKFGTGVLVPMPVESFGKESPDKRWFPCCGICHENWRQR